MNLSLTAEAFQNSCLSHPRRRPFIKKPIFNNLRRIGILTIAIFFFTSTQLLFSVPLKSQTIDEVQIKMALNNETLVQAFKKIEVQSPFHFMYRNEQVNNIRNLNVPGSKKSVEDFLKIILSGTNLIYRQVNNQVLITLAKTPATDARETNLVRGTVTNSKTEPLAGVSVTIKGESTGTSTDKSGAYIITAPADATLVFSYIGFTTQEVTVNNQTAINVQLQEVATAMNEVIVTALGINRSVKSLTYSAQTVKSSDLNEAKETNFINSLQGKVAGVTITKNATGPGSDSKVLLRGNRSITNNNQPLYVIDGVPLDGNIGMLNSDVIESMTVLKGASAAALYGSQGQNGAIIITTKKGKAGGITIEYVGGFEVNKAAVLPELQYEYGQGDVGTFIANSEHAWGPKATGQTVTLWNGNTVPLVGQPDRLKNFFRTAAAITNTISVSAGNDKVQTYFSYGNSSVQGIMRNNDLTRHNLDLKINNTISSKLSFTTKLTYIYEEVNNRLIPGDAGTYALPSIYSSPTSIPLDQMKQYAYTDASGSEKQSYWLPGSSVLVNPYWALNRILYYQQRDRVLALFSAKYKFNSWLDLQVRGSIDKTIQKTTNKVYDDSYFSQVGSDYNYGSSRNQAINADALLSFRHSLGANFNLAGNIGAALQEGRYEAVSASANGLSKPNFFFMNNARSPFVSNSYGRTPQVQSVYGTATFDYKSYLYLDITARNDWSSALPKESRSYFYPSVGLSAIVSDMLKLPTWVSYGKARITFANSGFGGTQYLDRNYYTVGSGGSIITPSIQSLGDYKPELTRSFEAGLDWQFFNNRLGFNFTYYNTKTKNQLLLIGLPPATLFAQKYINAGLIQNSGVELVLNGSPIKSENFSWDVSANYAKNNNKVIRLTDNIKSIIISSGDNVYNIYVNEGGSFGDMFVKGWAKDAQGRNLVEDDGTPILTDGLTDFVGNYNPDWMLGFTNSFSYKNFSLSFLIDHRQGGTVIAGTQAIIDAYGNSEASLRGREGGIILDGYTRDGKKNITSITSQEYFGLIGGRYPTAGFYSYSATNTRLRELTFGYKLPDKLFGGTRFIKGAKLSLVGRNLFFFQRSAPFDPELTRGVDGGGLEYCSLPSTRDYGINLKLSF